MRDPTLCLLCAAPATPESRETTAPLCTAHGGELDALLAECAERDTVGSIPTADLEDAAREAGVTLRGDV